MEKKYEKIEWKNGKFIKKIVRNNQIIANEDKSERGSEFFTILN